MRPDDCPEYETLSRLERLPAGDPRRAHLDGCAICRASLLALANFEHGAADPADATDRDAIAELTRRRVRDGLVPAEAPLVLPRRRFAWPARSLAIAALFVTVFGAWWVLRASHAPEMRATDDAPWKPTVDRRGRSLLLRWSAQAGADDYRVRVYDVSLTSLGEIDAGSRRDLPLDRDSLPGGARARAVEIVAMRGGDSIGVSTTVSLPVR